MPTAKALLPLSTHTLRSVRVEPEAIVAQLEPVHRTITPLVPTAITLVFEVPCTDRNCVLNVEPLTLFVHATPFHA